MKKFKKPFLRSDGQWNTYAYRSHSCPCSCMACQQLEDSYSRAEHKREKLKSVKEYDNERGLLIEYFGEPWANKISPPVLRIA